jgi:Zn-dependent protease
MSDFAFRARYLPVVLITLMIGLALHELAHAGTAYMLGDPTAKRHGRLTLNPLKHIDPYGAGLVLITWLLFGWIFGWAKPVPISPYLFRAKMRLKVALIGLAGPLVNFALAIIVAVIWNLVHPAAWSWGFVSFYLAFQLMVVLGVFNLLPIPPLDGSRVIAVLLPPKAYERWASLDQYGLILVIVVVFVFSSRLSPLYSGVMDAIRGLFVSGYPVGTF